MRKLLWFALGFAFSCGLCAYVLPRTWFIPLCLFACVISVMGIPLVKIRRGSLLCLGLAAGLLWCMGYRNLYLKPGMNVDGQTVSVTVTATDYSYATDYGCAFDGKVELEGKTFHIRTYINEEKELVPGDKVSGSFRLRYTPGGEESATYHPGKGIYLLGYQRGEVTCSPGNGDGFYPAKLAKAIKDILRDLMPDDVFVFAQALLLGDSRELDYETETAFKISGIRHIIAVSGLHVTILYSLLNTIAFRKRYLSAIFSFPALLLFAAVAGFTPSVSRACIMVALMILAQLCNKEYDPPTALSFAVVVMLAINPMVITSVSFQLSVGCVAGIQLFSKPIDNWLKEKLGTGKGRGRLAKLKSWFTSSVSITLGAMSLTTPLCAYYFGAVSLIGVVTNLRTLWVVTFVFNGLVAVCIISLLSVKIGAIVAWLIAWPIRYVLMVSRWLAAFPLAAVYTQSPYIVIWLILVYVLLAVFLLSDVRRVTPMVVCGILSLCLMLGIAWAEPLLDDIRVTVLDVGQGQSILLQSKGNTWLVDCGGDDDEAVADTIAETLLSRGISRLDGIIVTHCDRDHAGALSNLLTRISADVVFYPATEELALQDAVSYPVSTDLQISFETGKIQIFGPIYASDSNENSLCVLFTVDDCDILVTGDRSSLGEMILLETARLPQVDVLMAGHHGSKYSTSDALLNAVRPTYIFVSAGADNSYGHPAAEMLERAVAYGCVVYRTDIHGTLTFRR